MPRKKFFTPAQANAMLPLVSRIVGDITELASQLRDRLEQIDRLASSEFGADLNAQEAHVLEAELDVGRERMEELVGEVQQLGVHLKDYFTGLIDFPCLMEGREVYLCWRLGEPEVGHWHEVDSGFSGRQRLMTEARTE